MIKFLFVCTGNTCRSAMADSIMKHLSKGNNKVVSRSAGVNVNNAGEPISPMSKQALKNINIKPARHKSKQLTKELMKGCVIYDLNKIIADPFGGTQQMHDQTALFLLEWLTKLYMETINAGHIGN